MNNANTPGEIIARHEDESKQLLMERGHITAAIKKLKTEVSRLNGQLDAIDARISELDVIVKTAKAIHEDMEMKARADAERKANDNADDEKTPD